MKSKISRRVMTLAVAAALGMSTAASASPDQTVAAVMESASQELIHLLPQPGFVEHLRLALEQGGGDTVRLSEVMRQYDPGMRTVTAAHLRQAGQRLRDVKGLPEEGVDLLQLRLLLPEGTRLADVRPDQLRLAATPIGDQRRSPMLKAHATDGNVIQIDANARPAFPLLLVEVDTRASLSEGMEMINAGLQAQGMQTLPRAPEPGETLDISRLDHIRLAVDQESDVKGAAEIFVVVSGLQLDEKKPEMRTFEMPWLDHDKTDYYPAQDWIHWGSYRYDAANVQLFEEDGGTDYKAMLSSLITTVGSAIAPFEPTVGVVSVIADAVLKALPDSPFVDDHDYLDSFYLLRRGETYRARYGAAANAVVDVTPVTLTK